MRCALWVIYGVSTENTAWQLIQRRSHLFKRKLGVILNLPSVFHSFSKKQSDQGINEQVIDVNTGLYVLIVNLLPVLMICDLLVIHIVGRENAA